MKIPSVYRYMTLGLLLPILVYIGIFYGYYYGQSYGEFGAAFLAALGGIAGLSIATIIIVRVVLFWDKKILRQTKAKGAKRSRRDN
jgi:membrane associated rhomboid family serine protease